MHVAGRILGRLRYISDPALSKLWLPILYFTISALGIICGIWDAGDRAVDVREIIPPGKEVFDFIIVGAGSAGSVVAYRLSKQYKVLLLEAGGEPNPLQFIPGFSVFLTNQPHIDWRHRTVPQKYGSLNSVNQESSWSAGKGLGGTGNLNYMVHLRGHTQDYDNWAALTGDQSWSWNGVLPYFKSIEDFDEGGDSRWHGFGGPLRIGYPNYVGLGPEFVAAAKEKGYPSTDLNAPFIEGFDLIQFPTFHGARNSPYRAFIQPIRQRLNLTIRKFSHATQILFNDQNVAIGVEYDRHSEKRVAYAKKEVIISAGTITTPRILMLSGIGPASHLQELGIPVRLDLPVGQNLKDHVAAYLGPFFVNKARTVLLDRDLTPSAFVQWFSTGRGILSSPGANAAGLISSPTAKARGQSSWPDLVLYHFGFAPFKTFGEEFARAFNLKVDEQVQYYKTAVGRDGFLMAVSGARPYSKGYIKLGGTSPYDAPIIDPNYLHDYTDVQVLVEGVKATLQIIENSTALGKDFDAKFTDVSLPGCEHLPFRSDSYWECFVRRSTVTLHHPSCTCAMGQVVDTQLRVYGTSRLRVIDNSIQPEIITTNTQSSALMIGEKGSDMILKYWAQAETEQHSQQQNHLNSNGGYSINPMSNPWWKNLIQQK